MGKALYKSSDPCVPLSRCCPTAYHQDSEADRQAILGLTASDERPIRHPSGLFHCPGGPIEMHLDKGTHGSLPSEFITELQE